MDHKYIKFPFLGHSSYDMRKSLSKLLQNCYHQIDFRIVFSNKNTIGNFLKQTRSLPTYCVLMWYTNLLVLAATLDTWAQTHVGCFTEYVRSKVNPHGQVNGLLIHPFSRLEITLTIMTILSLSDFEILTSYNNSTDLLTNESIFIHKLKPCLI